MTTESVCGVKAQCAITSRQPATTSAIRPSSSIYTYAPHIKATSPAMPSTSAPAVDDEAITLACCAPISALTQPVEVGEIRYVSSAFPVPPQSCTQTKKSAHVAHASSGHAGTSAFFAWPLFGPLLFENETSDARDHCANERSACSASPGGVRGH